MQSLLSVGNIQQVKWYIAKLSQCKNDIVKNAYLQSVYWSETISWFLFRFDIYEELKILLRMKASTINIYRTRLKFGLAALAKYPIVSRVSTEITLVYLESLQRKLSVSLVSGP